MKKLIKLSVLFLFVLRYAETNLQSKDFYQRYLSVPDRMVCWSQKDPDTQVLLEKYKPGIFVSPESYVPVNFYADYLPQCVLRSLRSGRKIIQHVVDRETLKHIKNNQDYYLDYKLSSKEVLARDISDIHPTLYGRVYKTEFTVNDKSRNLLFLKYSFIVPYSGLSKKYSWWKKLFLNTLFNPRAWHELDIHGAPFM